MTNTNTMEKYITDHCNQNINKAIVAEHFLLWKNPYKAKNNETFALYGMLRCTISAHSYFHKIQLIDDIYNESICYAFYFNILKSRRWMQDTDPYHKIHNIRTYIEQRHDERDTRQANPYVQ